jgi:hypothetical protein
MAAWHIADDGVQETVLRLFNWLRKDTGHRVEGPDCPHHKPATGRHSVPIVDRPAAIGPDLAGKLDLLIRRSWGSREDNQSGNLIFDVMHIPAGGPEIFVTTLLKHVRVVAPRLSVPFMTPRIEVSGIEGACGQFVEDDGWVRLILSKDFALYPAASRAILCHEMSHYILFANGIRLADRADNERLTDVAIFVLGMGDIFLHGFRSKAASSGRGGHRMGYLADNEYHFLSQEVIRLRTTGELQLQNENELRGKLLNRLNGNKPAFERYMAHARQRFPTKSEPERIQALLDDFDRGR